MSVFNSVACLLAAAGATCRSAARATSVALSSTQHASFRPNEGDISGMQLEINIAVLNARPSWPFNEAFMAGVGINGGRID